MSSPVPSSSDLSAGPQARARYADFSRTGPGTIAGRYLRMFWQPVFVADDLPKGRARLITIMGEEFTLFRGEGGRAQVLGPRCPHRSTALSVGRVEGDSVRCFYHGWRFDASGQCVEQPAEIAGLEHEVKVRSYPTREYLGLVFAFLGEGEPPAFPHLLVFDSGGFVVAGRIDRGCNYFSQLENSVDEIHFNFVHRTSGFNDAGLNSKMPDLSGEETAYGIARYGRRGELVRRSHILMPNLMFSMAYDHSSGWTEHLGWRVPLDDFRHVSFMVDLVHLEGAAKAKYFADRAAAEAKLKGLPSVEEVVRKILSGELHITDVEDRPDLLNVQDMVALMGQGPIPERETNHLGRTDQQVVLLRKIFTRELRALEEGRPLKAWTWPSDLTVSSGVA